MIEIYKYKNKYKNDMAVLHVRFCFCIIIIGYYEPGRFT